jgi:kynurenine 3-monooxygenase
MSLSEETKSVAVIGAGLAGTMMAALLVDQGFKVTVYEKRMEAPVEDEKASAEFGLSTHTIKRSINLALSHRGILALERLGLIDEVMSTAIPMSKRVIHGQDGSRKMQAYGRPGQNLYSVSRGGLNSLLQKHVQNSGKANVKMFFGYSLTHVDRNGTCSFVTPDGSTLTETFDMVVGADGAFSAVRDSILKQGRVNFARKFVRHGYKELTIPAVRSNPNDPNSPLKFALEDHESLHIWPRGDFMLIALPNPDKTFTATLFAPFTGPGGFDNIDVTNTQQIQHYLQKNFPDAVKLMPDAVSDFQTNPVGSLQTLRMDPWNFGKVVLIGDAAHAVVPFFGQGMNAAFQDATMLIEFLEAELRFKTRANIDFAPVIAKFAKERQPSTDALADICLEHYHDMASNTSSSMYLLRKKVESWLHCIMPDTFMPFYTMVAFTTMPYQQTLIRAKEQEKWVSLMCMGTLAAGLAGTGYFLNKNPDATQGILKSFKKWF